MNHPLTLTELNPTELHGINGGLLPGMWVFAGCIVSQAIDSLSSALGTAVGGYVYGEWGSPVGTANPTGNEMFPYTDPLL